MNTPTDPTSAGRSLFARVATRLGSALRGVGQLFDSGEPDSQRETASTRSLVRPDLAPQHTPLAPITVDFRREKTAATHTRSRSQLRGQNSVPEVRHVTHEELRRELDSLRRLIESRK